MSTHLDAAVTAIVVSRFNPIFSERYLSRKTKQDFRAYVHSCVEYEELNTDIYWLYFEVLYIVRWQTK